MSYITYKKNVKKGEWKITRLRDRKTGRQKDIYKYNQRIVLKLYIYFGIKVSDVYTLVES